MHYCDADLNFMGKKWKISLFIIYKLFQANGNLALNPSEKKKI